jgi:ComF family protein
VLSFSSSHLPNFLPRFLSLTPHCALCNCACAAKSAALCDACHELAFAQVARCECCAIALPTSAMPITRCGPCTSHPPAFDATFTAADYSAHVRGLVMDFKFNHKPGLAKAFAHELANAAKALPADSVLIPVPLSSERLKQRGYNQSLEIAKHLARLTGLNLKRDALLRTRHTPAQSTLKLTERHASIKGAFACPARLEGVRILVVDDVMTSGATLEECARTLKKAGALSVTNLVVFRAALD